MFVLAALVGLAVAAATVGQHQAPQPVPNQFRAGPLPSPLLSASPSPLLSASPSPLLSASPSPLLSASPSQSEATPVPRPRGDVATLPTGGTPLPDIARARPGDDGRGPLPLGTINDAPNPDRLDFLFEFCWPECFRDAHWMDPQNPELGSGVWTAGRPFHVREGFINNGAEPLGDGFDVVLYVTRLGEGGDGATYRYTSDYVMRGTSERCGPTYETQTGPATCEWFVHDFPKGLPEGRFAIWAVWEAPCRAWIDLALTDACEDRNEVISRFSSGFDAPFTGSGPRFTEVEGPFTDRPGADAQSEATPVPRPRGDVATLPTGGTPLPDIARARPGDDGRGPLPLGTINDAPNPDRLDFLFEFCWPECFRDAHWMDPQNPELGSGVWTAGRPFHVREGFINNGAEPLGDGFDVVLYVTRLGEGGDGATYRYTSDYVMRGTSERCGPTYETQTGPATCEWFVHDFPKGLPEGRFAIWAVWEAPCRAWIDLALTDACEDRNEVISRFSSGFDAPFTGSGPRFTEVEGPFTDRPGHK